MMILDPSKALANPESVFKGEKYRITVLTERLLRLEYNPNGVFEDSPTQLVWYRNFEKPDIQVEENKFNLKITSKYFTLEYKKNRKFKSFPWNPSANLKISVNGMEKSIWYYGHPEARNFSTASYKLKNDKNITEEKSLYSLNGFASIIDSTDRIGQDGSFTKKTNDAIDVYVFIYNTDFYLCLNDYYKITGRPQLIPRYALGNWWSKDQTYGEVELPKLIGKFEAKKVPISIVILNDWYQNNSYDLGDYYKDPKNLIEFLKKKNIRVGLNIDTFNNINKENKRYPIFSQYIAPDKNGNLPLNVYDSRAMEVFVKAIIHPLNDMGVDFYNLDFYEKDKSKLNILKHTLYCDEINLKRPLLCSYNTIVPHRYSTTFAGPNLVDFDSLKDILKFNTSLSNLGMSYCVHDFGGTDGGIEDNELYSRFIQLGTFSPILKLASTKGKYYKREPWKWEIKTEHIVTDFLQLRYRLLPYIYTESYKYYKYGKPLIEPIYYRYPMMYDDINYKYNYFFGSTIYVSPIIERKNETIDRVIHKLFMPDGVWYDMLTGKKFLGNKRYISFYRDEEYPVFVPAGAIIPMSLNEFNDTSAPKNMEIQVFPGKSNTYSIYEDDGVTNNYVKGDFLITNIEFLYEKNNYKLTILPVAGKKGIIPDRRNYKIVFRNTKYPQNISTFVSNKQVSNTCYREGTDFVIKVLNVPTTAQLTITCSGDDIEVESTRIINEDIISIISDLPINTDQKQKIDDILFGKEIPKDKKRIALRKLSRGKYPIDRKYIKLFLNLLEYIEEL